MSAFASPRKRERPTTPPSFDQILGMVKKAEIDSLKAALNLEPNIWQSHGPLRQTLLHTAVQLGYVEISELMLLEGLSPNERDADGNTALHIAARKGDLAMVEMLANPDHGADLTAINKAGKTAFDLACLHKHGDTAILLMPRPEARRSSADHASPPPSPISIKQSLSAASSL